LVKKKASNKTWLRKQNSDSYVLAAKRDGFRSRASYKLIELDNKFNFLFSGAKVLDLGSSPGGWSQVAISRITEKGKLIACDILPMEPLTGATFIRGDFTESDTKESIVCAFSHSKVDLVMSDMAPNLSGMNSIDQPRSMYLAELATYVSEDILREGGGFVVKLFNGEGFDQFVHACRHAFKKVNVAKPKSSRPKSREVYLVGRGYLGESILGDTGVY